MVAPAWAKRYVGIPFQYGGRDRDGIDCYGLIRLVQMEMFDNLLPDYGNFGPEPAIPDLLPAYADAIEHGPFVATRDPEPGDSILLRIAGQSIHCGIVTSETHMLHAMAGTGSCLERYDGQHWQRRVCGFFRFSGKGTH